MTFWVLLFASVLLIPLTMVFFGKYFTKKSPKEINWIFGYRTMRSTKNETTWKFAHNYFGRLWFINGLWLCALTVVAMVCLLFFRDDQDIVGNCAMILFYVQMVVMIISIFFTERAIKKKFDDGNLRE